MRNRDASLILLAGFSHVFGSRVQFYFGVLGAPDFGNGSNDAIREIDSIDPSDYTPSMDRGRRKDRTRTPRL